MNKKIKKVGIKGVTASLIMATAITTLSAPVTTYAYNPGGDGYVKITGWNTDTFANEGVLWEQTSSNYNPKKSQGTMVSGDFDNDGVDEVASFYDYGLEDTKMHIFESSNNKLVYAADGWVADRFDSNKIKDRVGSGDFDGDGQDEIVAFYDYGNNTTGLAFFNPDQTGKKFTGTNVWRSETFDANRIMDVCVGDFDNNGKDEAVVIYDHGSDTTSVFEFTQTSATSFKGEKTWASTTFNGSRVNNTVVSGDFWGDEKDELAMFYDYGNNLTKVWGLEKNSSGQFSASHIWTSETFSSLRMSSKLVATKEKGTEKDKIIGMYDYMNNSTGVFSWKYSNGLQGRKESQLTNYEADRVKGSVITASLDGKTNSLVTMYDGIKVTAPVTKTPVQKATEWMINLANDNSHGYDQTNRWGPNYDCSSAVITAWEQAGVKVKSLGGATYTGNMRSAFISQGFTDVTTSVNVSTGAGLQYGDVLLNTSEHTAMYIGNGQIVHASMNEFGGITGGASGDQTGNEICTRSYYNHPWNVVLRYK